MGVDWIKTDELAEILVISARAVRKAIRNKKYVSNKINSKLEIYAPSLDMDLQQKIVKHFDKNNLIENIYECAEKLAEMSNKLLLTSLGIILNCGKELLLVQIPFGRVAQIFLAHSPERLQAPSLLNSTYFREWVKESLTALFDNTQLK